MTFRSPPFESGASAIPPLGQIVKILLVASQSLEEELFPFVLFFCVLPILLGSHVHIHQEAVVVLCVVFSRSLVPLRLAVFFGVVRNLIGNAISLLAVVLPIFVPHIAQHMDFLMKQIH